MPVAVNCWVTPIGMAVSIGSTSMDTRVAAVTSRVVVPETLPNAAFTTIEPLTRDVAIPLEPTALLIEATEGSDELQTT